jgi:hypothetical protein
VAPAAPAPDDLPRPLGDPLRGFRKFLGWSMVLQLALAVLFPTLIVPWLRGPSYRAATGPDLDRFLSGVLFLLPMPFLLAVYWILPGRATNAFYLRSFRNDAATWPVRKALQKQLGRSFRLSGIRDPRRRWNPLVRMLLTIVFCFRYCTPKYMNLEAGGDWKSRLWRSLGEARCAVLDLTDLTPFVEEEVELVQRCLGLSCLLFIVDDSCPEEEWRRRIVRMLPGLADPSAVQLARWTPDADGQRQFAEAVGRYASTLPARPAGLARAAYPLVAEARLPEKVTRAADWDFWVQTLAGVVLANVTVLAYLSLHPKSADGFGVWLYPIYGFYLYLWVLGMNYLIDCGNWRTRLTFGPLFLGSLLFYSVGSLALFAAVSKVRGAAERAVVGNQLKQIGLGFMTYQDVENRFPPQAIRDPSGKPLLSWRVALLPYLGEDSLYRQFKLEEPWDSPHNLTLLDRIPDVYAARPGAKVARHLTFYQVVVAPDGLFWFDRPSNKERVSRFNSIPDGASRTLRVVESSNPVPWTKPEDITWMPGDPTPKLGEQTPGQFHALACDGSSHLIPRDTSPEDLRALITPAGGEDAEIPGALRFAR